MIIEVTGSDAWVREQFAAARLTDRLRDDLEFRLQFEPGARVGPKYAYVFLFKRCSLSCQANWSRSE